jgi:protein BCP1
VIVDFEFFDPKEIDFHGLKALLGSYLDGDSFETSELADAIISQVDPELLPISGVMADILCRSLFLM